MIKPEVIRKPYFSVFTDQPTASYFYLFLAILLFMLPISSSAGNNTNIGNELISLTAKDEPLGDVLKKVSAATGYEIILDNNWQSYPVSISLDKVSLQKGLKRILKDLNNVIVYVSSKKINIIIYDKISPQKESSPSSTDASFGRNPVSRQRSYRPPTPDIPDPQALEKEEASPDDPSVSGEESETNTSDNDGEENTKHENLKTKTDESPPSDLEDRSSEDGSKQKNKVETSLDEETVNSNPQDPDIINKNE
ncbi:MAG: hypothetical protein P8012_01110 [Desulfobacterales bacterium]